MLHFGPPNKQEVSGNRADARESKREKDLPIPGAATPDKENKPMLDSDLEFPAGEELLAEIGLSAHTIREILADRRPLRAQRPATESESEAQRE